MNQNIILGGLTSEVTTRMHSSCPAGKIHSQVSAEWTPSAEALGSRRGASRRSWQRPPAVSK